MTNEIKEAREKLQKLIDIGDTIPFTKMFNPDFLSKYTDFENIDELFEKSGFKVKSEADFNEIPDDEWETYIITNTTFDSWEEMQHKAFDTFTKKVLNS